MSLVIHLIKLVKYHARKFWDLFIYLLNYLFTYLIIFLALLVAGNNWKENVPRIWNKHPFLSFLNTTNVKWVVEIVGIKATAEWFADEKIFNIYISHFFFALGICLSSFLCRFINVQRWRRKAKKHYQWRILLKKQKKTNILDLV